MSLIVKKFFVLLFVMIPLFCFSQNLIYQLDYSDRDSPFDLNNDYYSLGKFSIKLYDNKVIEINNDVYQISDVEFALEESAPTIAITVFYEKRYYQSLSEYDLLWMTKEDKDKMENEFKKNTAMLNLLVTEKEAELFDEDGFPIRYNNKHSEANVKNNVETFSDMAKALKSNRFYKDATNKTPQQVKAVFHGTRAGKAYHIPETVDDEYDLFFQSNVTVYGATHNSLYLSDPSFYNHQ